MRNGTSLLLLAALALASATCLTAPGYAAAAPAALEPTDSGAPSAIVMFPVSSKPSPVGAGMKPVVFNHLIHEKKIEPCETCHHTGDPVSCSSCHTVEGKAEGKFVTLERAMHATNIAKRAKGIPPSSCVSCHERQTKERRECAGCHSIVTPQRKEDWCATCHNVTPSMTAQQMRMGAADKLPFHQKDALATETVLARKPVQLLTPLQAPYKVTIDALADQYEPSTFTHRRHIDSLMERIKDDKLAQAFHNKPETLCATCHHRSPLSATPPKCGSCHAKDTNAENSGRPNLKAAYHLQCMGCHQGMQVARPRNTDCTTCHKARP